MKLSSLVLESFKSYRHLELPVDKPRVLVVGVNASGKSSIREGIKFALTGRCQGTDDRGAFVERLVPQANGAKHRQVHVSIQMAGIGSVTRTWTQGGSILKVDGFTGSTQTQQQALYDKLQTTSAFLDAVLDSAVFLRLHHADAKSLVLALLNVQITLGEGESANVYTLDALDELYKTAFEERRYAKKQLSLVQVPPHPGTASHRTVADISAQLAIRRGELETILSSAGTAAGKRQALTSRLDALSRVAPPTVRSAEVITANLDRLEDRLGVLERAEAEDTLPVPAVGDPKRIAFFRDRIAVLTAHDPYNGCVLDQEVACKTARVTFRKRIKGLEAMLAPLEAMPVEAIPESKNAIELREVREQIEQVKLEQLQSAPIREQQEQMAQERTNTQAALDALPDTSELDAKIADLRLRIQKGDGLLKAATVYWEALRQHESAKTGQQALQAEVDRLEALVEQTGPTGVRVEALKGALGAFETSVSTYTAPFGFQVSFTLEPWAVLVNGRSVETYSKSEQYRIGIAIQLAIASLSGLSFAVIDEMDLLDIGNRDILAKLLYTVPMEQILILGTREPSHALPTIPNFLCYRLAKTDGLTEIAERTGA